MSVPPNHPPPSYEESQLLGSNSRYYENIPTEFAEGGKVGQSELGVRMAFLRKVYSILTAQIVTMCATVTLFAKCDAVRFWVSQNSWVYIASMLAFLGTYLLLFFYRTRPAVNRYALVGFTAASSVMIGLATSQYPKFEVVLQALLLTVILFVSLTLFTFQSKYDFTKLGPILFFALLGLITVSIINIFLPFGNTFRIVIATIAVFIFCGLIIYDTHIIINYLYPDQYVDACISLYLDFVNLFLNLLQILSASDN